MIIPPSHLRFLVDRYQRGAPELTADGIYGPATARSIDRDLVPVRNPLRDAYFSALNDVGRKETPPGSNSGPFVEALREETNLPRKGGGEWCAVFVSAHLQRSGLDVGSRGAPGIVKALANRQGGYSLLPSACQPGRSYLALRKRGLFSHHVQFFSVIGLRGGSAIRHVGGNESGAVRSRLWSVPADFFKGVIKVVGYDMY